MVLSRRALLSAAAATLAPALRPALAGDRTGVSAPDWRALGAGLAGSVVLPDEPGYPAAYQLHDPRYDALRPPAVVRCATARDVVEAFNFARRYGLAVVPRGGGHSYVGASASADGMVIDVRPLASVSYDAASRIAVIGGGASLLHVYEQLAQHGVSVPGGSCGSVGIGGQTLGGGIGMASGLAGLSCDAVTAVELVTPNGALRVVDASREPDLYWACRGGGGGQVGMVTGWRMRTFPVSQVGSFALTWPWRHAPAVAAGWQRRLSAMPDTSWSTLQLTADRRGRRRVKVGGFSLAGSDAARREAEAVIAAIGREPETSDVGGGKYLDVVRARAGCATAQNCAKRAIHVVGSDIFADALPPAAITALLRVVERRAERRLPAAAKFKPLTNAVGRVPVERTAFAWRGMHTMLQWLVVPDDSVAADDAHRWIQDGHRALSRWSVGRYVNYLEPTGSLSGYYGPHLDRLRRVRAVADPDRLLRSDYAVS